MNVSQGWSKPDIGNFFNLAEAPCLEECSYCFVSGTSRAELAIHQETLARITGYVVNKATINASTPWEIKKLFDLKPELLKNIDLLLFDLEAFQFNDNCSTRFQEYNTFDLLSSIDERTLLLHKNSAIEYMKRIWPVSAERKNLDRWVEIANSYRTKENGYETVETQWRTAFEKDPEDFRRKNEEKFNSRSTAARHMNDFSYSPFIESATKDLIDMCAREGVYVCIIIPPMRPDFLFYLKEESPDGYAKFKAFANSLDSIENVTVYITEQPSDLGLSDEDGSLFMDYGHLTRSAAIAYTTWLGEKILTNQAIKPKPGEAR